MSDATKHGVKKFKELEELEKTWEKKGAILCLGEDRRERGTIWYYSGPSSTSMADGDNRGGTEHGNFFRPPPMP